LDTLFARNLMEHQFRRCAHWIDYGEGCLNHFEDSFFRGDLTGATDALKGAWRASLEPISILTNCWDGEFWEDWPYRGSVENNIETAQEVLLGASAEDMEDVMTQLKDLMLSNFHLLKKALSLLCADLGPEALSSDHRPLI